MKKRRLDAEIDFTFTLFGLITALKEYKLAWLLNSRLDIQLDKTKKKNVIPIAPTPFIAHRYLLQRNFTTDGPDKVWVSDITYVRTVRGWLYLTVFIDLFSRMVVGWALSSSLSAEMVLTALARGIRNRRPGPGLIIHSDRGVQYASAEYVKELKLFGFQISMSRKGNPYDNAFAESFMKTLKSEEVHLWEYRTMEDVQKRIPYFIEDVYNHKRLHSAIGYRPPCEFEMMIKNQPNPGQNTLITLA